MSMNVSVGDFVCEKAAQGEYEAASEVVREGLQLFERRKELWQAKICARIEEGMASCRAGRTISAEQAWAELHAWRDQQKRKIKP